MAIWLRAREKFADNRFQLLFIYIYIYIYTNIAESRIERDYWPRYAHAARQMMTLHSEPQMSLCIVAPLQ